MNEECFQTTTAAPDPPPSKLRIYNPAWPLRWLQRLCIGVLRRLGCEWESPDVDDGPTWLRMPIPEAKSVMEMLAQQRNALRRIYDREIDRVVMGPDEARRLLGEMSGPWGPSHFDIGAILRYGDEFRWCGIRVQYVPWFQGVLVLPKMTGENR